jgi:hypothetical protein
MRFLLSLVGAGLLHFTTQVAAVQLDVDNDGMSIGRTFYFIVAE